jgi:hypothetical protein
MQYYTYAYLREDGTPYYIGKGKDNRAYVKRYGNGRARRPKNPNNIILLKQNITEEEAFKHEKYMIAVFGRKDLGTGILRNLTDGGDGPSGHIPWNKGIPMLEEVKEKISCNRKGIPSHRPGFKHTNETKELCRQAHMGKKHTEKTCEKMSKTKMGHLVDEETRKKIANSLCKETYLLKHISGKEVLVNNFTQFCRENNLHHSRMMDRITGKVKKLYKGWTGQVMKSVLG